MKCDICGMKVEGSVTGIINVTLEDDGWVEVADEVSSFIHDDCYALALSSSELWKALKNAYDDINWLLVEGFDTNADACNIDGVRDTLAEIKQALCIHE